MFQYEFFNLKDYLACRAKPSAPKKPLPDCFVRAEDIKWIRSSYWSEHCLECGEPLCYETCPNYQPRADKRCRLLSYGMYDAPGFKGAFYHVAMRFKKWGKIETTAYPGAFTPEKALQIHDEWMARSKEKALLMHLGKYGLRKFPIEERRKFDGAKYTFSSKEDAANQQDTPDFLLQLYSCEKEPFTLFFDITDDTDLVFREGITVSPGYNQLCMDVSSIFPPKGRLRAKLYPADNREVSLVLLFCEFVQLMPGVQPEAYPAQKAAETAEAGVPAQKVKCVAWDLDNTLWDGILIEADPHSLTLRPGVRETMEQLDARGILQIAVSKNDAQQAAAVLQRLGVYDYFVYIFANWNAKSANLAQAARLLNLGIDSFALIDDSAFERSEVASALPMVRTYGDKAGIYGGAESLLARPELDVPVTADSRSRRQMYQTEAKRIEAAGEASGTDLDFLRSCRIEATLSRPADEEELLRSYELLQRTNQLNLSGSKYQQEAFYRHVRGGERDCFILKCADRFGSYGQVAYLETQVRGEVLEVREFAMSCRVAAKQVEPALTAALLRHYASAGINQIKLIGTRTTRNELLVQSFTAAGFTDEGQEGSIELTLDAEKLRDPGVMAISIEA